MRGEGRGRRGFFVLDDFEICFNSLTELGSHHHAEQNLAVFLNKSNSRRSDHGAKERWLDERKKTANSSLSQRPGATDPSFNPPGGGSPLYDLNGEVRPDKVWFSAGFVLNGVSISSIVS